NPHLDGDVRALFNRSAAALHVPPEELEQALAAFATHGAQGRPLESGHPMAHRNPPAPRLPEPGWLPAGGTHSAMDAVDEWFVALAKANPDLRIRIGNPDELGSNKMGDTLALLRHRVNEPEPGVPED